MSALERRACALTLTLAGVLSLCACGRAEEPPRTVGFLAQCLGVTPEGDLVPGPVVCRVDGTGTIESVSEIDLALGLPFVVDPASGHVLAIARSGALVAVDESESTTPVADAGADAAYAFTAASELVRLGPTGELRSAEGELVTAFAIDGVVDVESGIDIREERIAFTVERPSGRFAVVVGDTRSGEIQELFTDDEYVGQARWSPDGRRLAVVGPDYSSIIVLSNAGAIVATFRSGDPQLPERVNGPRWIDDERVLFFDGSPALLSGAVATGIVSTIRAYDTNEVDAFPVLPIPLDT